MYKKFKVTVISLSLIISSPIVLAEIQLSGEIKQGGLLLGKTSPDNTVTLDGEKLTVSVNGDFVFGFGRDDESTHNLLIVNPQGKTEKKTLKPAKREYKIQRIEGIAKKIMSPDPKAVTRAKKDSAQVRKARSNLSKQSSFAQGFIAPSNGIITGVYGSQRFYNGKPKSPHYGLDYAGDTGDAVKAPADGTVILYVGDMFYSGGTMIIDHGQGITSSFLHLSKSYVKAGDKVKKGQVVAAIGSSGRATGPHLDWRINWFQVRLDPALVLKALPLN